MKPPIEQERVVVTQADREAAADRLTSPFDGSPIEATQEIIRSGKRDAHPWVQAFARHRLAAISAVMQDLETPSEAMIEIVGRYLGMHAKLTPEGTKQATIWMLAATAQYFKEAQ